MNKKIVKDRAVLADTIKSLKEQGKKIVLTNGGFNILHVGHVRSLIDAKSRGDVLLVALNGDNSLKALKGANYPIVPEDERLQIVAALECVDLVTTFNESTADAILLELKPHFHAKGTDYSKNSILERETVLSYGGEIAIVGDPKNHSTSNIVDAIRKKHNLT
jgi:rfaE bifunctional protein nucleotidyltransferase chain/domain